MSEQDMSFEDVVEQLRTDLNEMLMGMVEEPVKQALAQIPAILQRTDWNEETKLDALEKLQLALVSPFLNATVNVAQGAQMDLGRYLFFCGKAWEEIRSVRVSQIAQEMLNKGTQDEQIK